MKKRWLSIYAIMAMILMLAACGTTEKNQDNEANNNNTPEPEEVGGNEENNNNEDDLDIDEAEKDDDSSEEDTSNKDESTDEEENNNDEGSKDDEEIVDGTDDFLNEAQLTESDEQDYSIYLLPSYKLTSEEPGKDSLYLDEDGSIFMRIETTLAEESTYDYLLENMLTGLAASSSAGEPIQLEDKALLPSGESIENAQAYTVDSAEGPVTGILFERDGMIVRLTMFDSLEAEHFQDFLSMGETITKTE